MAKLPPLIPKVNVNLFHAFELALLFGLFKTCSDLLMLYIFGSKLWVMVLVSSLILILVIAFILYLILEMRDAYDNKPPSSQGPLP